MLPSASELSNFVEVASTQNVSRAAERLGISQPSLSLSLQRLEHAVGAPLLLRSRKGVTLTQAGKQLLAHARDLLQKWESVRRQALASVEEIQGSFTLGCHPSVALYSLGGFLPGLIEKHPMLEIKLHHDLSRKITESVISMETDLGIVVNPVEHPDLVIRTLCHDQVTFWTGPGMAKVQNYTTGDAILICDPELLQTQALLKKLKETNVNYSRILRSSNLEVIASLVSSGAGIGIIPARVVGASSAKGLKRIPGAPIFEDEICLLYRVENKTVRSVQVISEAIVQYVR